MNEIIQDIEHQRDRITLYKDMPNEAQLEVMLTNWIKQLKEATVYVADVAAHDTRLEFRAEITELRNALADANDRITRAKEIL